MILKAYAPIGIKFWENQETALAGLKEFANGWFARRHKGMQAALEAAKHIGHAETPSDMPKEYQNWLTREAELIAEDEGLSAGSAEGRSSSERTAGNPKDRLALSANDHFRFGVVPWSDAGERTVKGF